VRPAEGELYCSLFCEKEEEREFQKREMELRKEISES